MDYIFKLNSQLNEFLWDRLGLVLLFLTGVLLTFITKFFQFSHFYLWIKKTLFSLFKKEKTHDSSSITRFQAICTTLASSVGVGNIVGVATAVKYGGSGAVFWMWIASFMGMALSYGENILTIYFRTKREDGVWLGGPMYTLKNGFSLKKRLSIPGKILAVSFCIFCIFASFGIGNISQINAITENIISAFPSEYLNNIKICNLSVYRIIIASVVTFLCAFIISGGLKRVAEFTEKIVPFMVIAFITCCGIIIFKNRENILPIFKDIIQNAFCIKSAVGSAFGLGIKEVIKNGFRRGLFSNEAGLGSSPIVNASSEVIEPAEQGMWGIFQVFCDTVIICSLTAFVILTTQSHLKISDPAVMTSNAFSVVFGSVGEKLVALSILLFAFTSILGWSQYGVKTAEYLKIPYGKEIYLTVFIFLLPLGCFINSDTALEISDTFNALMMIPNLLSIIAFSPLIVKISENYLLRQKNIKIYPLLSFDKHLQNKHLLKLSRLKNSRKD